jgi:enamine deaminase RidA (YjgF/YER057c/UK114 family)
VTLTRLQPPGWPAPRGYANGIAGEGLVVCVAGMIGWDAAGRFAPDFLGQARQCFVNIRAVLAEAGAEPAHLARLTWFVREIAEYRAQLRPLGLAYREVLGAVYPAMTLVQVAGLVEPEARLEIEATAIIPASAV